MGADKNPAKQDEEHESWEKEDFYGKHVRGI